VIARMFDLAQGIYYRGSIAELWVLSHRSHQKMSSTTHIHDRAGVLGANLS
jgi:hypothetical protein